MKNTPTIQEKASNLPVKAGELAKFILFGGEKLIAMKARYRANNKAGLQKEIISQRLEETQMFAEDLLDAEVRMGQILSELPKDNPNKRIVSAAYSSKMKTIKELGLNQTQAQHFETLAEHPDIVEQVKQEAKENDDFPTRTEVLNRIKTEARGQEIEKQKADIKSGKVILPEGLSEVIIIDPPWNYGREYDPDGSRVANPYPEMTQDELAAMKLQAAPDSVLFLWTTHAFIFQAKELMDIWGFEYKCVMVWDKEKMGIGSWLRMQCEFCLIGIKGKPLWTNTTWRDIIHESRREHSRKPEEFYKMVKEITTGRIHEYFSRTPREGISSSGNDPNKF